LNSESPNHSRPEKRVWVPDLFENEFRVGAHWDLELSERADDLGDDVAVLAKAIAEEVSVNLFDLVEIGTPIKNSNDFVL
jgi:hypothetical protein